MNQNDLENEVLIEFKNLTKKFGHFTAVNDLSLRIFKGEVLGFLGPNGAGKSTAMKMMANLLNPTSGEVWVNYNHNLERLTKYNQDFLLDNIGFLIENPAFYADNTPRQVLTLFAKLKGYPREKIKDRVEDVVKMIGMGQWIDNKLGTFSKGMRQKIGIISAIVHDPAIIVLDEPHTGLDPKARREVRDFLLKLKAAKKTVFLSSHLLYEVSEIADRVAIISHGILVACDTLDNLEEEAKKSVIDLELIGWENPGAMIKKINEAIGDFLNGPTRYNPDQKLFELQFDGSQEKQYDMLHKLITSGIKVIEFSVPKAGLLEDLYLKYVSESDRTFKQYQKKAVKVESIL